MTRYLTCLYAGMIAACESATGPHFPAGATPWVPPARYALWWRMTEACSELTGDLGSIQWYVVPNSTTIEVDGKKLHGYWFGSSDRIVLADAHRLDGELVRHEMLHALLGDGGKHRRDYFVNRCNGIVACDGACDSETGGRQPPPPTAPELLPSSIGTRFEVEPRSPSASSADSGAIAVIVSITNPLDEPAWIRMTPQDAGDDIAHTFGFAIDYDDPARVMTSGYTWHVGTRFPIGPRETRRYVWDEQLSAGRYGIRGYFNSDTARRVVLDVAP
jgi:hypothetical protein